MINLGPKIKAPKGYVAMLVRNPKKAMKDWYQHKTEKDCELNGDHAWIWKKIKGLFTYKSDSFDKWTIPDYTNPFEGDCEDFALACRQKAVELDVYGGRLLLCKERKLNAVAHCVFLLGDWVMDCRLDKPCDLKTFKEMYTLYAISSPALMGSWYRVEE
ncbi:MAG: transglutaminase-like cysteine peptidase [Porticoccus sp.]|nr:transglutaminase-like cysteine peptidase [Porticoccus sp.]